MLSDRELIKLAIDEDLGTGDITTDAILGRSSGTVNAVVAAREQGVLSGSELIELVFQGLGSSVKIERLIEDGSEFEKGTVLAELGGDTATILKGERLVLNFLSHLSGVATHTARLARIISDYNAKLLDTRKTTPLLRKWEKRAVVHGGGVSHRMGLYDHVLIKDNHIAAAGSIEAAIARARANCSPVHKIEIEIDSLDHLETVVELEVDWVMLDNMSADDVRKAAAYCNGKVILEASGGITAETIVEYAKTGVDYISSGDLIKGARPIDIGIDF